MKNRQRVKMVNGFSLVELMVVLLIVGILASIALPNYNKNVLKSRRGIAKAELMKVVSRQEQYFINNKIYATDLTDLAFTNNPYYINDQGDEAPVADSFYQISFVAGASAAAFVIQAVPQRGQVNDTQCATISLGSTGVRNVSGSAEVSDCW